MSAIERMTITVPAEMAAAVKAAVAGGDYASTSEVIRDALREWVKVHDAERRELEALRLLIRQGLDSGESLPADDVFAQLRARFSAKS